MLHRVIRWLGLHDYLVLAAITFIALGTYGFVKIMAEVRGGEARAFDESVMRWVAAHPGPPWAQDIGRDITALGGVLVLTMVTIFVVVFLMLRRMWHAMWLLIAAAVGGGILTTVLKLFIDRARPEVFEHRSYVSNASFPSGHSMSSAVVYLTLGSLLARFTKDLRLRLYFVLIACFLTFIIGLSRIYMGVHWPTDVLAGWSAGAVWACVVWTVARILQVRGAMETEIPSPPRSETAKDGE